MSYDDLFLTDEEYKLKYITTRLILSKPELIKRNQHNINKKKKKRKVDKYEG